MKNTIGKLTLFALAGAIILSGCSQPQQDLITDEGPAKSPAVIVTEEDTTTAVIEDSTETETVDPASGTSLKVDEETAKAMAKDRMIEGIKKITLRDVDGNEIDRSFSAEEIKMIETAFNESYIMDTMYIEMITGYNMTIDLENGDEVFITSYGDPVFIVARIGDGETYHLGCEAIATILLEGTTK